jgi:hypothetical protein
VRRLSQGLLGGFAWGLRSAVLLGGFARRFARRFLLGILLGGLLGDVAAVVSARLQEVEHLPMD